MNNKKKSSNYEEELKVIFQTYQIPLGAQGELSRLFEEVIEKNQFKSWLEGFDQGRYYPDLP